MTRDPRKLIKAMGSDEAIEYLIHRLGDGGGVARKRPEQKWGFRLTQSEDAILSKLIRHAPDTIPSEALYGMLYAGMVEDPPHIESVSSHIKRMRPKIPKGFGKIRTDHGVGYWFDPGPEFVNE